LCFFCLFSLVLSSSFDVGLFVSKSHFFDHFTLCIALIPKKSQMGLS